MVREKKEIRHTKPINDNLDGCRLLTMYIYKYIIPIFLINKYIILIAIVATNI